MGAYKDIRVFRVYDSAIVAVGTTLTAGGPSAGATGVTTDGIDLGTVADQYTFSVQLAITTGTVGTSVNLGYVLSNDNVNFLEPDNTSTIVNDFTDSSGPLKNGKGIFTFTPMLARYMKISAYAHDAGGATVTVDLAVH